MSPSDALVGRALARGLARALMLQYGGGGHQVVGTCQVPTAEWEKCRDEIVAKMKADG